MRQPTLTHSCHQPMHTCYFLWDQRYADVYFVIDHSFRFIMSCFSFEIFLFGRNAQKDHEKQKTKRETTRMRIDTRTRKKGHPSGNLKSHLRLAGPRRGAPHPGAHRPSTWKWRVSRKAGFSVSKQRQVSLSLSLSLSLSRSLFVSLALSDCLALSVSLVSLVCPPTPACPPVRLSLCLCLSLFAWFLLFCCWGDAESMAQNPRLLARRENQVEAAGWVAQRADVPQENRRHHSQMQAGKGCVFQSDE